MLLLVFKKHRIGDANVIAGEPWLVIVCEIMRLYSDRVVGEILRYVDAKWTVRFCAHMSPSL